MQWVAVPYSQFPEFYPAPPLQTISQPLCFSWLLPKSNSQRYDSYWHLYYISHNGITRRHPQRHIRSCVPCSKEMQALQPFTRSMHSCSVPATSLQPIAAFSCSRSLQLDKTVPQTSFRAKVYCFRHWSPKLFVTLSLLDIFLSLL